MPNRSVEIKETSASTAPISDFARNVAVTRNIGRVRSLDQANQLIPILQETIDLLKLSLDPYKVRPDDSYHGAEWPAIDILRGIDPQSLETRVVNFLGDSQKVEISPLKIEYALARGIWGLSLFPKIVFSKWRDQSDREIKDSIGFRSNDIFRNFLFAVVWESHSDHPDLEGKTNPFMPHLRLYNTGLVKAEFESWAEGKFLAHYPIRQPSQKHPLLSKLISPVELGCWREGETEIGRVHSWDSPPYKCI